MNSPSYEQQRQFFKQQAEAMLKEDKEMQKTLEEIILDTADQYDYYQEQREGFFKKVEAKIPDPEDHEIYYLFYEKLLSGQYIPKLEKALSNMVYSLNKAKGKIKPSQKGQQWQEMYNRATSANIEDTVRHFFPDIKNFRKNISCPFHGEDSSPSMKIYSQNNRFHCFGCNASGSAIDFVKRMQNCDFKEAVHYINDFII